MCISLLIKPVDQQRRQMAVRFYSKWYCATSSINIFASRFRFTLNRYIVRESAYIKVCPYQVMVRNGYLRKLTSNVFFLKHFVINYVLNFMYIYNAKWKIYPKWKYYDFVHEINCTRKHTWVYTCACACMCNCMCIREQYMNFWKVIYENDRKKPIHFITNISILYGSQTCWSYMKFYFVHIEVCFVFKKKSLCLIPPYMCKTIPVLRNEKEQ